MSEKGRAKNPPFFVRSSSENHANRHSRLSGIFLKKDSGQAGVTETNANVALVMNFWECLTFKLVALLHNEKQVLSVLK